MSTPQIVTDLGPYNDDTDFTCMVKIATGVSPLQISILKMSPELCRMLEQCWNKDPGARPSIPECIAIIECILPLMESPEPGRQHLIDLSLHHSTLTPGERADQAPDVALSSDASLLPMTHSSEDEVQPLWNSSSDISSMTLTGHQGQVYTVAFSPNGLLLASGSGDRTIRMWDSESGNLIAELEEHRGYVNTLAFARNGTRLAAGTSHGQIIIWDGIPTGPTTPPGIQRPSQILSIDVVSGVCSLAISPNGRWVASAEDEGTVKVWDAQSGRLIHELKGHSDVVSAVSFSSDGRWLASCSRDQTVRIWDAVIDGPPNTPLERVVTTLRGHTDAVRSVTFSPNVRWLASASFDITICIWDVPGWSLLNKLTTGGGVYSLMFSPESSRLAFGGAGGMVRICETRTWTGEIRLEGHTSWVNSVAFSPDGTRLASGSSDKTVRIWRSETRELTQ